MERGRNDVRRGTLRREHSWARRNARAALCLRGAVDRTAVWPCDPYASPGFKAFRIIENLKMDEEAGMKAEDPNNKFVIQR